MARLRSIWRLMSKSNWDRASSTDVECIHCTADARSLERRGDEYFCNVCSRTQPAYSDLDVKFLKVNRIQP